MLLIIALLQFVREINTTEYAGVNLYQISGVDASATQKEIKKSYSRYLKQKKHNETPSERTLRLWGQVEMAYSIIGNEYSRALYDLFGIDFLNLTDFRIVGYQSDETIEAVIKMLGKAPPEIAEYGGMVYYPVEFELKDFMTGAKKVVDSVHSADCECPKKEEKCKKCEKEPIIDSFETNELVLPKGASEFYRFIGRGMGDTPTTRGASDVVFVATSVPHPVFERSGRDLLTTINCSLAEVLEGKNRTIKGLDGKDIDIPLQGAQNNMKRKIANAGLPDFFMKNQRGDLIVTINLEIPSLTKEQRESIKGLLPEDPSLYL